MSQPTVWIWQSGLWFFPGRNESLDPEFRARLECVGKAKLSGTVAIVRTTTPYAEGPGKRDGLQKVHALHNAASSEILSRKYGFKVLDAAAIVQDRAHDLSNDGVHYSGVGSKWITNVFLNMIC
jgi:hypothetical protein